MQASIEDILKNGGIGILPTDTIYGLVGSALNQETVEKIYQIKKRSPKKPPIILIAHLEDLLLFGIILDSKTIKTCKEIWPGPTSIVLPCPHKKLSYLHRGVKTLAFRLPKKAKLLALINKAGPIIAPSANPEGLVPAETLFQAQKYFPNLDFYIDGGNLRKKPSKIVRLTKKGQEILRR